MTTNASGRSLVGTIRSAPGLAGRVEELEAEVARLRDRVQVLESTVTALDAVRDEVAALSVAFTEELNRVAGTSTTQPSTSQPSTTQPAASQPSTR